MSNFDTYFGTAREVVDEGTPGSEAVLTQEFVAWFDDVSAAAGCTFVSAELNREHCDGPSDLETRPDKELIAALVAAGEGTDGQGEAESA